MLPNALTIGVDFELFFRLTPKEIRCFSKAFEIQQKRQDYDMYIQASYIYEALTTVMQNSFGKQHKDWRKKPYSVEAEEARIPDEEIEHANGMAIMKNLELSMTVFNATHSKTGKDVEESRAN